MIHISTSFALLVVAIIILVCIAGSRLSGRLGVPTLFIFIMLGMLFDRTVFLRFHSAILHWRNRSARWH
ncbi:MAG: hypothetical protein ACLR8P_04795 [Clostridium fessum]